MPLSDLTIALLNTLAGTPGLAGVRLANESSPPESANLPAGVLVLVDATPQADADRLTRVRFELSIWRRDIDQSANVLALARLADDAVGTIQADSSLAALTVPTPAGASMEIARLAPARSSSPVACLALQICCQVLPPEALVRPTAEQQVRIDNQPMLASGMHWLTIGEFGRRRIDRTFAGLDGVVSIDLGATHRPIVITGRLVADTADELVELMAALSSLNSTEQLHTLSVGDGRTFGNVRLEQVRWGRPLASGTTGQASISYELHFAQLAL